MSLNKVAKTTSRIHETENLSSGHPTRSTPITNHVASRYFQHEVVGRQGKKKGMMRGLPSAPAMEEDLRNSVLRKSTSRWSQSHLPRPQDPSKGQKGDSQGLFSRSWMAREMKQMRKELQETKEQLGALQHGQNKERACKGHYPASSPSRRSYPSSGNRDKDSLTPESSSSPELRVRHYVRRSTRTALREDITPKFSREATRKSSEYRRSRPVRYSRSPADYETPSSDSFSASEIRTQDFVRRTSRADLRDDFSPEISWRKRKSSPVYKRPLAEESRRREDPDMHSLSSINSDSQDSERRIRGGKRKVARRMGHEDSSLNSYLHHHDLKKLVSKKVEELFRTEQPGSSRGGTSWTHHGPSPFVISIERTQVPKRFTTPSLKRYAGRSDPGKHIQHYQQMMSLHRGNDTLMCKVFPTSLEGPALSWFSRLESRSIHCWEQLADKFTVRFIANSRPTRTLTDLLALRKNDREGIWDYVSRYFDMMNEVEDCPPTLSVLSFRTGLPKQSELFKELTKRPPRSVTDLLMKVDEAARLEDEVGINQPFSYNKKEEKERTNFAGASKGRHSVTPSIMNGSPKVYAVPFTKKVEDILEQVKEQDFFKWPNPMQGDPANRNLNFYCAYHRTNGHRTEGCRHLRNHLQELARLGHLSEFCDEEPKEEVQLKVFP